MKLRHKLLLMMLAVFLLLTSAGTGIIIQQSFTSAVNTEKDRALTEAAIIASAIYQRAKDLELQPLRDEMAKQEAFYKAQGVTLSMLKDGRTLLGEEVDQPNILPDEGARRYLLQNKKLLIAQRLSGSLTLLYERDLSILYDNRDRLLSLALLLCVSGSVLILASVLIITRVIMRPIDKLRQAAAKIASGDYTVSLPTRGQDETAELARQFEKMTQAVKAREEELKEQSERKQLFIDSLAHEMRTPLTAVMGYARYLQSVNADAETQQKALAYIAGEAKRLKNLDETLMSLARMTHDSAEFGPVDIPSLIEEAAQRARPLYEGKGVSLNVQMQEGVWQGDEALMLLIVGNLLQNALTASAPGGKVTIAGTPDSLSVSDTGIGMTQEQLDRACDPFYKADKARTRKAGGAGLGLTLVKQAANLLGAQLTLTSKPGEGTTASLIFDNSVTTA
jgi:signal transduction histidine kinase